MATVGEVSRALNLSVQRVHQLVNEGMPRKARGVYELGACMSWYIRFLLRTLEAKLDPQTRDLSAGLLRQRTRRTAEEADTLAMKNQDAHADLVPLALIEQEFGASIDAHATRMHELLGGLAPALEGMTIAERQAVMDAAAVELLEQLVAFRPPGWTKS